MKSSMIMVAASAALGLAGVVPRDTYTQVDVVYEYVTVTAGAAPSPTPEADNVVVYTTVIAGNNDHHTRRPKASSTAQASSVAKASSSVVAAASSSVAQASPTGAANYASPTDLASAAVFYHNKHRSNHSSPDVTWASDLASYAAQAATACDMNHNLSPGGGGYGQNLASWGTSGSIDSVTDADAVGSATSDMWYDGEFASYAPYFGKEPGGSFEDWGHLTQVVWAGSKEVGCAVQRCPKGTMYDGFNAVYIVCNYRPAGNVGGGYAANVGASNKYPSFHT